MIASRWRRLAQCLGLVAALTAWCATTRTADADAIVARVDGDNVTAAEIQRAVRSLHSAAKDQTRAPAPQAALAALVRQKVQLRFLHERGEWPGPSGNDLREQRLAENSRRLAARAAGQPVYGPVEFSESAYFAYRLSQAQLRVKTALAAELRANDAAIVRYYDAHKATEFSLGLAADVLEFRVTFTSAAAKPGALQQAEAAARQLSAGASFEQVAAAFVSADQPLRRTYTEHDLTRARFEVDPSASAAHRLRIGETSSIIERAEAFAIVRVVARDRREFLPLAECRELVVARLADQRYAELLVAREHAAHVEIFPAANALPAAAP